MRLGKQLKCSAMLSFFVLFSFKIRHQLQRGDLHSQEKPPAVLSSKSEGPVALNNRGVCCAEGRAEHTSY